MTCLLVPSIPVAILIVVQSTRDLPGPASAAASPLATLSCANQRKTDKQIALVRRFSTIDRHPIEKK